MGFHLTKNRLFAAALLGLFSLPLTEPAEATTEKFRCGRLLMRQLEIDHFFMKFRGDYLPFGALRASRARDRIDLSLIRSSYQDANYYGPVERGIVELVDRNGVVIASERVYGTNEAISGLNQAASNLLYSNDDRLADVALVRKRHTHPQDSRGSIEPAAFSDNDMRSDLTLSDYLASKPEYSGISLESWIVYLDPNIERFYPEALELSHVRIRGYQLR